MERLKDKSVLVVDASQEHRDSFRELLSTDMDVLEADSVEAAIDLFLDRRTTIDLVLLDLFFPDGREGFELISWMRDNRFLDDVPVIVVSEEADDRYVDRAFELGAVDFVRRPYAARVLERRALTTVLMYQNKKDLIKQLDQRYVKEEPEVDDLTKLLTKKAFFEKAGHYLDEHRDDGLCMIAVDIDHFKLYNQFFGRDSGDRYLKYVSAVLRGFVKKYGGIVGYAGADSFYYLCPDNPELFAEIQDKIRFELRSRDLELGYAPKCGAYRITDRKKTILDVCDCANSARASMDKEYSSLIVWYDGEMEQKGNEFRLLRDVEYALRNHEFTFFLQPKCNMLNGKLVGAEALVRWVQRGGKMISPGVFVPVLENNGFITKVDCVVWEDVCRWQRFCLDMDYPLLPISINISRADFFAIDVCTFLTNLMKQYELPMDCVELEITESAYTEENQGVSMLDEINRLKAAGFKILMDDFGSGYSSLNSLKDIDIDILKIDMRFLKMDLSNMEKGVSIIETIVNMAHAMHLAIVVEGVETAEQVKFLTSINCLYAQGYYYYKPLNQNAFEDLLIDPDKVDPDGIRVRDVEQVHLMSLSEENLFTDEMINNLLGPIAFYEVSDGVIRLLRLNEQYYKVLGMADVMADPEYAIHLRKNIHPEDRDKFYNLFIKADSSALRGATADIRYIRKDGSTQWLRVRAFPLKKGSKGNIYYASLEDVTEMFADQAV